MKKKYLIIDCYVDEPACFGVPPFVSPYPRYIYGALAAAGADDITSMTIDALRERDYVLPDRFDMAFLVGGAVVPGRYLGSKIGTLAEVTKIIALNRDQKIAVGGLISHVVRANSDNAVIITKDIEKFAASFACGSTEDHYRTVSDIGLWGAAGAPVVRTYPGHPELICEIETYRGCPRSTHCSFCSEGLFSGVEFRTIDDILREIDSLIENGITRFRIGRQADILQYGSSLGNYVNGFPEPDPSPVKELFSELKARIDHGKIDVLNIDNANPGTIVNHPERSSMILETIASAVTPGDTMALGVESFDETVIQKNGLKVTAEGAFFAVKTINEICGRRERGIPVLLPGINLVHGLTGETMDTFETNYNRLREIRDAGLLVKRINIRKVAPFPGTPIYQRPPAVSSRVKNRFEFYKAKIREEIDTEMVRRIYPAGTVIDDIVILDHHQGFSYGKRTASYSMTVKIPQVLPLKKKFSVVVTGQAARSLSALTIPININVLDHRAIASIPGAGKKKASEIILARPFYNDDAARSLLPHCSPDVLRHMTL